MCFHDPFCFSPLIVKPIKTHPAEAFPCPDSLQVHRSEGDGFHGYPGHVCRGDVPVCGDVQVPLPGHVQLLEHWNKVEES